MGEWDNTKAKELLTKWLDNSSVSDSVAEQVISEFGSILRLSVEEESELLSGADND